jgi:predicted nucleic acid-binding protein
MGPGVKILLDTVILIDYLRRLPPAEEYVECILENASISVITRAEVLVGVTEADKPAVTALLDWFPLHVLDKEAADLAATLRRSERWKLPDACQAALAQHHGLQLATRDTKDFPPERYGFVVIPYIL